MLTLLFKSLAIVRHEVRTELWAAAKSCGGRSTLLRAKPKSTARPHPQQIHPSLE
jgi:hypothetical protein